MRHFAYQTVDVFTTRRFGGNPLAVFTDARGLEDVEMQSLAAELNYSETTFVLPPEDPKNTARVRIFNRTSEMPFAGHPNVGTAFVLAVSELVADEVLRFEVPAGLVTVRLSRDSASLLIGAEIDAPQPLTVGDTLPADAIAACVGLSEDDIVVRSHEPCSASVGISFYYVEVTPDGLTRALPSLAAFQNLVSKSGQSPERLSIHCYARGTQPNLLHARMFAPLSGTWEDPATGSANATLAAYLLSLSDDTEAKFEITQGVEMGRPSQLVATAARTQDGIRATVGGSCVLVLRGEADLE